MSAKGSIRIEDHFRELTDPRRRKVTYPLINIVKIALCAVISGADDFVAITEWTRAKKDWLARFLDLSAGLLPRVLTGAALARERGTEDRSVGEERAKLEKLCRLG